MKQLLFLLLFPCLALAQYPGNAGQKITLGEQTSADGLVYRGVANDTNVITPFSDTSAYIILDTVNSKFYHYNRTTTYWSLAGGGVSVTSFSGGSTGLTPSDATTGAVTLGGTLAVANGGTGTDTAFTQGSVVFAGASGTYTQDSSGLFYDNITKRLGLGTANPSNKLTINEGEVLVTTASPTLGYGFNLLSTVGGATSKGRITSFGDPGGSFIMSINGVYSGSGNSYVKDNNNLSYWDLAMDGRNNVDRIVIRRAPIGALTDVVEFMRINSSGNVGIGTTNPLNKLDIAGSISLSSGGANVFRILQSVQSAGYIGPGFYSQSDIGYGVASNSTHRFIGGLDGNTELMRINGSGNVGIGTTTPQSGYRLHVVDSVYVGGNVSASAYTTRSDYDLKDEIQNISYGINEVMQMQPVKYTYKSNGSSQLGFIAQDLGVITPEVVSFEDKMSVYYNAIIPILTKAIQEQQVLIKALEQRIINLENK